MPIDLNEIITKVKAIRQRQEVRKPFVEACRQALEQIRKKEELKATIEAFEKRRAARLAERGDAEEDVEWITVNGVHIPVKEGELQGEVGKKIEANGKIPENGNNKSIDKQENSNKIKVGSIPKERLKHISTGTFKDGKLINGCHGQKGFIALQNKGLLSDVRTLKNGVRMANVKDHDDTYKRERQGQTFFPDSWDDHKISSAVKEVWRNNVDKITTGNCKFTESYNGVKISVCFRDKEFKTAYPEKYQGED